MGHFLTLKGIFTEGSEPEIKKAILREGIEEGTGRVWQTDLIWQSNGNLYITEYYSMSSILDTFEILKHERNDEKSFSNDELKKLLM